MGIGEDKTIRKYNDVPFEVVCQLVLAYEERSKYDEAEGAYDVWTEKITKLKGVLEYIAKGGNII